MRSRCASLAQLSLGRRALRDRNPGLSLGRRKGLAGMNTMTTEALPAETTEEHNAEIAPWLALIVIVLAQIQMSFNIFERVSRV